MKRFWTAMRYSGVGVFAAGIIGVIQGCSVEREGLLFAFLILVLQFCSGPIDVADNGVAAFPTGTIIDALTVAEGTTPRTLTCGVFSDGLRTVIPDLFEGITIRDVFMIAASNGVTGDSDVTFTVPGDGTLTISATGAPASGCDYPVNFSIIGWENPIANVVDLSVLSAVAIPVILATSVTGCTVRDSFGTSSVAIDPEPPGIIFPNPGWAATAIQVRLTGCNFGPGATLVIGPPIAIP